jgi:hypothetical protein
MARKYGLGQIYRRGDIWWVDYLYCGVRYWESTGSTRKQDASRLLKQRITEIHSDTFMSPTEQRLTVNDLLDALQQDYVLGAGKSLHQFLAHMRPVREALGRIRAADLSEIRIDRYIKERFDTGRKPSTVNRETQHR